jgi:hypothetical protein
MLQINNLHATVASRVFAALRESNSGPVHARNLGVNLALSRKGAKVVLFEGSVRR